MHRGGVRQIEDPEWHWGRSNPGCGHFKSARLNYSIKNILN